MITDVRTQHTKNVSVEGLPLLGFPNESNNSLNSVCFCSLDSSIVKNLMSALDANPEKTVCYALFFDSAMFHS